MSQVKQWMTDEQIEHMVQRFLQWRLPENFNPDAGISFKAEYTGGGYPMKHEPVGTNLFDYEQTQEMVRYMVDGMPARHAPAAAPMAEPLSLEKASVTADALVTKHFGWPWEPKIQRLYADIVDLLMAQTAAAPIPSDIHEAIGRIMHESWAKTKRAQGYHGPNEPCCAAEYDLLPCGSPSLRSEHCKTFHPDLIHWDQLPEQQKDINRHAFDAVLESGLLVPASAPASEREAVLEEAAKHFDNMCAGLITTEEAAAAIRALKGKAGKDGGR